MRQSWCRGRGDEPGLQTGKTEPEWCFGSCHLPSSQGREDTRRDSLAAGVWGGDQDMAWQCLGPETAAGLDGAGD